MQYLKMMANWENRLLFTILLFLSPRISAGLKLAGTVIPSYGILNRTILLRCSFQLGLNDSLYTLKWYKDGHEFFRFRKKDSPPITTFPLAGVFVNERNSSLNEILIGPLSLLSKGVYRCEVSADAPTFQTVFEEKPLNVMVLPTRGPIINGMLPWYNIGDNFSAMCSVEKSFPKPNIVWFVNDIQVDGDNCDNCVWTEVKRAGRGLDGTEFHTAESRLHFFLETQYFKDGYLTVECKVHFGNSHVVLVDSSRSRIKSGLGGLQYALSSATPLVSSLKRIIPLILLSNTHQRILRN